MKNVSENMGRIGDFQIHEIGYSLLCQYVDITVRRGVFQKIKYDKFRTFKKGHGSHLTW
jgi:hypothetical protein